MNLFNINNSKVELKFEEIFNKKLYNDNWKPKKFFIKLYNIINYLNNLEWWEKKSSLFDEIKKDLKLENLIRSELNYMRPILLVLLLKVIKTNESKYSFKKKYFLF